MKKLSFFHLNLGKRILELSFIFLSVIFSTTLQSQIPIANNTPIIESFDAMGTSNTASLPANWKMSAAQVNANWSTGTNVTAVTAQACSGSPTAAGKYNWGTSANSCADRALGVMTSGTAGSGSPNTILAWYQNTSGSIITDLTFSFDFERYRINSSTVSVAFFTSTDGTTWTARTSGDVATTVFTTGASAYNFATPQTTNRSLTFTGINVPVGGNFYTKWLITNTGSSNSQGIGLDNVNLTATVTSCSTPTEPTTQSNSLVSSSITATTAQLNWTRGNGSSCLVVAKASSAITSYPTDNLLYSASAVYGNGSTTGASQYVVYNGTGNSCVVGGLSPSTSYYFEVYEFNSSGACTNYFITTPGNTSLTTLVAASYNFYRGNIHAHTAYSDGDIDGACPTFGSAATCCYAVAKTANYFDFMGLADHNHNESVAMTIPKYASGVSEAAAFNTANPGSFVALYGMEWGTISTGGHACIYGVDQLVGWNALNYDVYVAKGDYTSLFNLVASTANAFAYLAHPNSTDFNSIFSAAYNATYDAAIIGISMENGPYNSTNTTYTDPPAGAPDEIRYKDLLKIGYHVGPGIDLDNHNSATMGKTSQGRTVVLASSLSRSNVYDAYLNRRFYATEDYNVDVYYTINSTILMGSITSGNVNPVIAVSVSDADAELVSSIEVWYGVPGSGTAATILTSNTNSSTLNYTHAIAVGSTYYYYIKIVQADGSRIWTAPIWFTMNTPLPIELIEFKANLDRNNFVELNWKTKSETNNNYFTVQRTLDGLYFEDIAQVPGANNSTALLNYKSYDYEPLVGQSYYRLVQTDFDGVKRYSSLIPISLSQSSKDFVFFPNPTSGLITISTSLEHVKKLSVAIYDIKGALIDNIDFENQKEFVLDLNGKTAGIYLVKISSGSKIYWNKVIKE
jgi:hypothetical protein